MGYSLIMFTPIHPKSAESSLGFVMRVCGCTRMILFLCNPFWLEIDYRFSGSKAEHRAIRHLSLFQVRGRSFKEVADFWKRFLAAIEEHSEIQCDLPICGWKLVKHLPVP